MSRQLADLDVHLTTGLPAPGITRCRTSHEEALAARRVARSAPSRPRVTHDRDVEVLCLVTPDDPLVQRMVRREIGPLRGGQHGRVVLRRTVLVLENGHNVEATADRLYVHPNSVRYRVARAEGLLGRPLGERIAPTELALRIVDAAARGTEEVSDDAESPARSPAGSSQ